MTTREQQIANTVKWIEELRSGRRLQTRHRMFMFGPGGARIAHCCLGVASELFCDGIRSYDPVIEACGLGDDCMEAPLLPGMPNVKDCCVLLNDERKLDFPAIADWLEQNHLPRLRKAATP